MKIVSYLIVIGIIICSTRSAHGIIGYDCGSTNFNVTTLSLLDVDECNIPLVEPHVQGMNIQLLQLSKYESVDVIQCKVAISRTIYYCGMHSHVATVTNAQAEYLLDISAAQCKNMHMTGIHIISSHNVIHGLKINQTVSRPVIFAGSVTTDGKCTGAQYSDPYGAWDNVVVQGIITISLRFHSAAINIDSDYIHLKTGTICKYSDGYCIDSDEGYTFWQIIPSDYCKFSHYDVLYEGKANKVSSKMDEKMEIIYSLSTRDITFALTQTGEELLCGFTLIKTEHPKLLILEMKNGQSFTHRQKLLPENIDIFAYVNSKFVYVERHIRTQMNLLYRDVLKQRCDLERQVLKNALNLAIHSPEDFALQVMKKPGHMAVLSGEVIHIIKCTPVEVKVRHIQECYQQLPVMRGNDTYFLTPRTHILLKTGTQVSCSRVIPTMYLLHDGWYRITPNVEYSKSPTVMKPMTKPTWQYSDPGFLAASGIYTEGDLENLRDHIMFAAEKNGILNTVARGVTGESVSPQGISLSHLLDEKSLQRITESAWKKIWGRFLTFGNASAGIIGIYFCIRTIKLIIDTVIHGYALHTIYGWSIHLAGALWDSVTNLLLHLASGVRKKNVKEETKPQPTLLPNAPHHIAEDPIVIENETGNTLKIEETRNVYPRL